MPLIDSSPLTGGTVAAPAAATVGSLTVSPSGLPSGAVPYPTASGGASFANNYPPLSATPLNVLASSPANVSPELLRVGSVEMMPTFSCSSDKPNSLRGRPALIVSISLGKSIV